jgi:hypothetical protein
VKKEGRCSFLKKRTKKLFSVGVRWRAPVSAKIRPYNQKFFASFFQKRRFLTSPALSLGFIPKGIVFP